MKVSEIVYEAIKPIVEQLELVLVDVQYQKKQSGMHLIVLIDKTNGVQIDDCTAVSKAIDSILEELNPTNDAPYNLDVSSYGLDKPLFNDYLLNKYIDKKVEIKLYQKIDGVKLFVGKLISFDDSTITINYNENKLILDREKIASIFPYIEF